jgi:two-component system, NtrC family, response regulator HydG
LGEGRRLERIGQEMKKPHRGKQSGETQKTLERVTHALRERVKELNCLYAISELVEEPGISVEEILKRTIQVMQPAWQYPEVTCARITLGGQVFESEGFKETPWRLSAGFSVTDDQKGLVEVHYAEPRPPSDEGPFLKEEVKLVREIAEKLGRLLLGKLTEESLKESEERYRALAEHVTDGVTLVQEGKVLFANPAFLDLFGFRGKGRTVGRTLAEWLSSGPVRCDDSVFRFDGTGVPRVKGFKSRCTAFDGRELWVEGEHIQIQIQGKPAVLSTFRDVTERVKNETAIKEEAEMLRQENIHLRSSMKERYRFRNIIGKSQPMQGVYELILKAARSEGSVHILGESGTGKELVARAIHELSGRGERNFVTVNCGAIPENLLESEFFGHKKGAFTSAHADKVGYLDIADGGTLFLDEVGELTLNMQVKLLRAIDGGDYMPVGSIRVKKSNFRVIAATNRDLLELVQEGAMREDFFYRVNVIPILLPPLRDRKEDIPLLVDHFLKTYSGSPQETRVPPRIMDAMLTYPWPGNVRELQNAIRRYLSVGRWDLLRHVPAAQEKAGGERPALRSAVKDLERSAVRSALEQTRWHRTKAAQILGISRRALARKIKALDLE